MKKENRLFAHATGNHQVVVYGDYRQELGELCRMLKLDYNEA